MRRLSNLLALALLTASLSVTAGRAAAVDYLIEVQTGGPGTATPSPNVVVPAGGSQTFTFTPDGCYGVVDVTVDDVSVGSGLTEYTFTNVQSDHVLYVSFGPHPTTTTLDVRPVVGQCAVPETLTATVPNVDGGQVQFFNGATLLGTRTLTAGVATYVVAPGLPTGSYAFTANYLGASCAYPSSSPTVAYDVADTGPTPVTLSLTQFRDTLDQHASVSATATLRIGGAVAGAQNGQVIFYDGPNVLGTIPMENGRSSWSFQMNSPGVHVLYAVAGLVQCPGTTTSEPETLFVRESTSMTLTITPMQVNPGESVLMTAVVSPSYATGSIHFLDVTATPVEVGTASLVDGVASFTYGPLSEPSRVIQARYDGDALVAGCTSDQVGLQVGPAPTNMILTITPTLIDPGESVLMTASVGPSYATGTIHFLDVTTTTVEVGAASLVDGAASFTYGPLSGWGRVMQARYDGDAQLAGCTSNQVFVQVRQPPPVVDTTLWITNGTVFSVVANGSTIYIGGDFTRVGPATGTALALDASTGAAQQPYPKVSSFANSPLGEDGAVYAVAPDGSGGWYLGGSFTKVCGQPRNNLAQLDAAGNLTAWNPNASNVVKALVVSGGTVYVGGWFSVIGGQVRTCIAALDAASGVATDWNPAASGGDPNPLPFVNALAVSGGTVYVGGNFTRIGGQTRNHIAALDAATGVATAWNPNATDLPVPGTATGYVNALAVSGGTVYAGGQFISVGGQERHYIAALSTATGLARPWNPIVGPAYAYDTYVNAIAVSGGTVYVGGNFTSISGQRRNGIAALDAASGAPIAWDPNATGGLPITSNSVNALVVSGSTVYAGGKFTNIGGQPRNYIAALDAATGAATMWNPNLFGKPSTYGATYALAVSAGTVYAGGSFAGIGGQARNYIAALDAATGAPTGWDPNANSTVRSLTMSGGTVYAGGSFTSIGGQPRNYIAALDATTGAATAWDPSATGGVSALAVSGGTVYAGGGFSSIGGQARSCIAALDAASGAATAWNPNANAAVNALAVSGGTVYAGGYFTSIGGRTRSCLAALDAETGAATGWHADVNTLASGFTPAIAALAVSGGTVYAGGYFVVIGSRNFRNNIAAIDATTGAVSAWDPNARGQVLALAVSGGTVYAGGTFSSIGGQIRRGIALLDAATGAAIDWSPNVSGTVFALAMSGGTVYVGGDFSSAGGQPQGNIAAISAPDIPVATLLAQFEATTSADGIELRWSFGDQSQVTTVVVERAPAVAGPWLPIAPELHDESGVTMALDRTAGESKEYFYRLVVQLTGGGQTVFGPVSASSRETPSRSDLTRLSPNPTSGGAQVQYSVARAGRVRLEVLDVSGRVEETLADRAHTPGRYVVSWDGVGRRGRASPGLYFVRLVAPDQVMTRKLAIIQ